MKAPGESVSLPLDYAAELAFEIQMMRGECCDAAQRLVNQSPLNEKALEQCARLDDALARAQQVLHSAVKTIRMARLEDGQAA